MSLRCILGYHAWIQITSLRTDVTPYSWSLVNGECRRCHKREWFNWPPEAAS